MYVCIYLCIYLVINLFIYLSIYVFIYLFIYLFVYILIYNLFICVNTKLNMLSFIIHSFKVYSFNSIFPIFDVATL